MEKVGAVFFASVFAQAPPSAPPAPASVLAEAAERFVRAIAQGTYPLMPPPSFVPAKKTGSTHPQVRPHQLLDACARSPIVRERYRALVEASIAHVAVLTQSDQAAGTIRSTLDASQVGTLLVAMVIGVQTMAELGVTMDPAALARTVIAGLSPAG